MALALNDLGYKAVGIRIDSGDLAYLSNTARNIFERIAIKYNIPWFAKLTICASNDINEETILSLNEQVNKYIWKKSQLYFATNFSASYKGYSFIES